jgi:hypothetical protein
MSRTRIIFGVLLLLAGLATAAPGFDTLDTTLRAGAMGWVYHEVMEGEYWYNNDWSNPQFGHWECEYPPLWWWTYHSMFTFDLSSIPDTALVTGAEFGVYLYAADSAPCYHIGAYNYSGDNSESLYGAVNGCTRLSSKDTAQAGWNYIVLNEAAPPVITQALATDRLRLACVWECLCGMCDAGGSSPCLTIFYLPTGVEERTPPDARRVTLSIAPNPCRKATKITVTPGASRPSPFGSSVVIRTSEFPSGVYVVELRTGGSAYRRKLVVH